MPRDSLSDDPLAAQRLGRVAVRAADDRPLAPCHPARARALVRRGRAEWVRRDPPLIRLQAQGEGA
jgi:hypothetical protein